jgi:hypothetical protein
MSDVITVIETAKIERINRAHHAVEACYGDAVARAIECGQMLEAVKADLQHGRWLPWLEEHFDGSTRVAQTYMQLAASPLADENAQSSAHFNIDAALKQIAKPKPRAATSPPQSAASMLGGMEDDDEPASAVEPADVGPRFDAAQSRLKARAGTAWETAHSKRRQRIIDLLDAARGDLDSASDPHLAAQAIAELLRSAEVNARKAAGQLGELAFTFER